MDILRAIADCWVCRRANPDQTALAAVAGLEPAIVITGASEGLGFALARHAAREQNTVILIARSGNSLEEARRKITQAYPKCRVLKLSLDVSLAGAAARLDQFLDEANCYLDVLVNNAAIGSRDQLADGPVRYAERLIETNIGSVTRLTGHYLPQMRRRARGGIINVASLAGFVPGPWHAVYFASKAYVLSLTIALNKECAGEGVRVCALAPGPVRTALQEKMDLRRTLYNFLLPASSPETIARRAWRSYELGRRAVVPGLLHSALAWICRALPVDLSVSLVSALMRPRTSIANTVNPIKDERPSSSDKNLTMDTNTR